MPSSPKELVRARLGRAPSKYRCGAEAGRVVSRSDGKAIFVATNPGGPPAP